MSSVDFQVWELYVYMQFLLASGLLRTSGSLALGRYLKELHTCLVNGAPLRH